MYTAVCRKVVRKSATTPKSSVNSFKVFREIWKNVSLRKTHRGFDKFILFARLTFNSKPDEKCKKNGPISMNNRNNIKLNENKFWVTWAKNILKNNILLFCSSHIHMHVGICQNLSVSIKTYWSLDTQITFRDFHMHFFLFPTTFLLTAVNVNSHLSLLFLP